MRWFFTRNRVIVIEWCTFVQLWILTQLDFRALSGKKLVSYTNSLVLIDGNRKTLVAVLWAVYDLLELSVDISANHVSDKHCHSKSLTHSWSMVERKKVQHLAHMNKSDIQLNQFCPQVHVWIVHQLINHVFFIAKEILFRYTYEMNIFLFPEEFHYGAGNQNLSALRIWFALRFSSLWQPYFHWDYSWYWIHVNLMSFITMRQHSFTWNFQINRDNNSWLWMGLRKSVLFPLYLE